MYAKQQQYQQQHAIHGQYHAFATSLATSAKDVAPIKQSKSQQLQSNPSSAAGTSMGFPKARKVGAGQKATSTVVPQSAAVANHTTTNTAVLGGKNAFGAAKTTNNHHAAIQSNKPKVGKQLTDMLIMTQHEDARPSITGDIDDVANLISPSPRRKPGKIYSAKKYSNMRFTKLEIDNNDIGNSLQTEESQMYHHHNHHQYDASMKQHKKPTYKLDSFDEDSMMINAARDFNSHLMTPQQISQISASEALPQQPAQVSNTHQAHGIMGAAAAKGARQHHQLQKQSSYHQGISVGATSSNLAQFHKHQPISVHKQPLSATSVASTINYQHQAGAIKNSHHQSTRQQVPLQSSIESKKLATKHPNNKTSSSKPFSGSNASKQSQQQHYAAMMQHTIQKSPPKLFASKQQQSRPTLAMAAKHQGAVPPRKPNIDTKALNQQSCDLIVSTMDDDGANSSEMDHQIEEREPTDAATIELSIQKNALPIFNQQPMIKKKQQVTMYQPQQQYTNKQGSETSTGNGQVLAQQKKNVFKATTTPKQIEIELGYDEKDEESKLNMTKTGPSSHISRSKPYLEKPVMPAQQKTASEKSTSVVAPTCSVILSSSFPVTENEIPLDERAPNMVTTIGAASNCQATLKTTQQTQSDYSIKQKCRQKYLNQTTVIDLQPAVTQPNTIKDMKKTIPGSKIQPVPTLSLNSFKNRQQAPATSRNPASTATNNVKKAAQQQTIHQPKTTNLKRGGATINKADQQLSNKESNFGIKGSANAPLGHCSSPQLAKTMESVASLHPIIEKQQSSSSNLQQQQTIHQSAKGGSSKTNMTMTVGAQSTTIVLASGSSAPHQQTKSNAALKEITTSSSVDARRSTLRQRMPASVNRQDLSVPSNLRSSHHPAQHMQISLRPSGQHQQQHANISIDLTTTPTVTRPNRSTTQNKVVNGEGSGGVNHHNQSNSQYKTESLERILGSQAESYFRQIERTMQMAPVNVTGAGGSRDGNSNQGGGTANAASRSAQRQASLHSQSSRFSAKTAQPAQVISLAMPGIAEQQHFSSINKLRVPMSTMNKKNYQLHSHALLVSNTTSNRETRLASAEKSKSSYKSAGNPSHQHDLHFSSKAMMAVNNNNAIMDMSHHSSSSNIFNKTTLGYHPTSSTSVPAAPMTNNSAAAVNSNQMLNNVSARNDRLVAHRRIDLICSGSAGGPGQGLAAADLAAMTSNLTQHSVHHHHQHGCGDQHLHNQSSSSDTALSKSQHDLLLIGGNSCSNFSNHGNNTIMNMSQTTRGAKLLLTGTNKYSFNNYNNTSQSSNGGGTAAVLPGSGANTMKAGAMTLPAAISRASNTNVNQTTTSIATPQQQQQQSQQNLLVTQMSSSGRRAYRKKSESALLRNNMLGSTTAAQAPKVKENNQNLQTQSTQQHKGQQSIGPKQQQSAIIASKPGSVGRKNQIRLHQTPQQAISSSTNHQQQRSANNQNLSNAGNTAGDVLLLATTRNSKSSFSSTHRPLHHQLSSINKQSQLAKDWVMCLPNEPPQIIHSQEVHTAPSEDERRDIDDLVEDCDENDVDKTRVLETGAAEKGEVLRIEANVNDKSLSIANNNVRGIAARDNSNNTRITSNKSLLHPSAQKKAQNQQRMTAGPTNNNVSESKESVYVIENNNSVVSQSQQMVKKGKGHHNAVSRLNGQENASQLLSAQKTAPANNLVNNIDQSSLTTKQQQQLMVQQQPTYVNKVVKTTNKTNQSKQISISSASKKFIPQNIQSVEEQQQQLSSASVGDIQHHFQQRSTSSLQITKSGKQGNQTEQPSNNGAARGSTNKKQSQQQNQISSEEKQLKGEGLNNASLSSSELARLQQRQQLQAKSRQSLTINQAATGVNNKDQATSSHRNLHQAIASNQIIEEQTASNKTTGYGNTPSLVIKVGQIGEDFADRGETVETPQQQQPISAISSKQKSTHKKHAAHQSHTQKVSSPYTKSRPNNNNSALQNQQKVSQAQQETSRNQQNSKLDSSAQKQQQHVTSMDTANEYMPVTTDDEAAQYYDRLTSLFQETRQKLREFDDDFQRKNTKQQNQHQQQQQQQILLQQQQQQQSSSYQQFFKPQENVVTSGADDGLNNNNSKRIHQRSEDTRDKNRRLTLLSSKGSMASDNISDNHPTDVNGYQQQSSMSRARESLLSELNRHQNTLRQQKAAAKKRQQEEKNQQNPSASKQQQPGARQSRHIHHRKTATQGSQNQLSSHVTGGGGGQASSSSILYRRQNHAPNSSEKRHRREKQRFVGRQVGSGDATDIEVEERKVITQKAKKSFINLDEGTAGPFDCLQTDTLLMSKHSSSLLQLQPQHHSQRSHLHHSAPRRHKGIGQQNRRVNTIVLDGAAGFTHHTDADEQDLVGRDSNQYYGDDIQLQKQKYATNSTNRNRDHDELPVATAVDDYYLTNDESIDFMVNSRGKKKGQVAAPKENITTSGSKGAVQHKPKQSSSNSKVENLKIQRESRDKESRRAAAQQMNKSSYEYPKQLLVTLEADDPMQQTQQMASSGSKHKHNHRRGGGQGQQQQLTTHHLQHRGSLPTQSQPQLSIMPHQPQPSTTNATIYINNLMNGVQHQQTAAQSSSQTTVLPQPLQDLIGGDQHSNQLLIAAQQQQQQQYQQAGLLPPEMCRTQSQIVYPTSAQLFGHQKQSTSGHTPQTAFINQQSQQSSYHPQFAATPTTTGIPQPQQILQHPQQMPQQQIVFVPVHVYSQGPPPGQQTAGQLQQPGIHQVSSAPHFTTQPSQQLLESAAATAGAPQLIGLPSGTSTTQAGYHQQNTAAQHFFPQTTSTPYQLHNQHQQQVFGQFLTTQQSAPGSVQGLQQPAFTSSNSTGYLPSYLHINTQQQQHHSSHSPPIHHHHQQLQQHQVFSQNRTPANTSNHNININSGTGSSGQGHPSSSAGNNAVDSSARRADADRDKTATNTTTR